MNSHYHQCLAQCKHLHQLGVNLHPDVSPTMAAVTADKLIYNHAIEMVRQNLIINLKGSGSAL